MKISDRLRSQWPTALRDASGIGGAVLIAYGLGQVYGPLGFIALGAMMVLGAVLSAKASG